MTELPFEGRIALVTGASRGIGHAAALALAKAGAHVVATARTQGALEALDDAIRSATGAGATLAPLDLKEPDGLDALGKALFDRFGRVDVVVAAAADLGLITPLAHLDPRTWDRTLAVNLTANYRLIRSMDPLLRLADAGRAVFLTSGAAAEPTAFWGPYAVTKAGLERTPMFAARSSILVPSAPACARLRSLVKIRKTCPHRTLLHPSSSTCAGQIAFPRPEWFASRDGREPERLTA
jgi:NAD(P)-dependent dehydrogenase (short-subunit alcohol dehydrogenase family)